MSYSLSADVSESESSTSSVATFSSEHRLSSSAQELPTQPVVLPAVGSERVAIPAEKSVRQKSEQQELSESEMMKERFAKLLLGEDMSGGGKGVGTALAISNAITNLAATVFGQLWKLEPLPPQKRTMWHREMEWLLCVTDSIVELVPSLQEFPGGGSFEIMVPQQRSDLFLNLPALKKLDGMLMNILDSFQDTEFFYVDRGIVVADDESLVDYPCSPSSGSRPSIAMEEKWWLPFPKVPPNGLSRRARRRLQQCKECTHQIFKAAVAINSSVLAEIQVPQIYIENMPKSEKACLGETLHRFITAENFSPECLIDYLDLSSNYTTLELANRIESAIHFWRMKHQKNKKPNHGKTSSLFWGNAVNDAEKSKLLAHRAETLLKNIKLHFPGLPQTSLDTNKIQYNKDVGQAILESYSRVLESLAFNLMARIDDLLYVDDATKRRAVTKSVPGGGAHFDRRGIATSTLSPMRCAIPPRRYRRSASQPSSRYNLDVGTLTLRDSTNNGRFHI
ncbi:hypothetical protein M569_12079 [Genlisea aurea]|uniref:PRONE domain-containing protein n=1 Tax=Genlisea aurea TaxID=192259 RepID=S8C7F3_9LAMI|nr:hypothetical protein M569_12079 [Genlisea aurea]